MKVLVFSDTHLSTEFDGQLFDYIAKLIKSVDQVIINGDFWDWYLCSFDEFVNSQWQRLFPLLKTKNAIYLYGNHDPESVVDDRVQLFSVEQGTEYSLKQPGGLDICIEHGDRIAPEFDVLHPRLTRWFGFLYKHYLRAQARPGVMSESIGRARLKSCQQRLEQIKEHVVMRQDPNRLLICGHTHLQSDQRPALPLIVTGPFWRNMARYVLIDDTSITLREEPYA